MSQATPTPVPLPQLSPQANSKSSTPITPDSQSPLLRPEESVLSTLNPDGSRRWLTPKPSSGRFWRWRRAVAWILIVVFAVLPWIRINGKPAMLLDVMTRKFVFFGTTFRPTDTLLLALLLLSIFVGVFLLTALFGRVWCGWACPQTIFMELIFRRIEYAIEGDWTAQKRLNEQPWTTEKLWKKGLKHLIFFTISVIVANWFLAYIIGMDSVKRIVFEPIGQHLGGFAAMIVFSLIFYGVFAFLREQVCVTICPYGRLQGVLLVKETIVVAYDYIRGEPRGKLKKQATASPKIATENTDGMAFSLPIVTNPGEGTTADFAEKKHHEHADGTTCTGKCEGCKTTDEKAVFEEKKPQQAAFSLAELSQKTNELGDCIDCKLCIHVCPTGIDIRNGTQLECVNCTACIDACDEIMDKVGRPTRLIAYNTIANQEAEAKGSTAPVKYVRARTLLYLGLIALVGLIMLATLFNRSILDANVIADRNPLFVRLANGDIRNGFTIKILNKLHEPRTFTVGIEGLPPNAKLLVVGQEQAAEPSIVVPTDVLSEARAFVSVPNADLSKLVSETEPFLFVVKDKASGTVTKRKATFRRP